VRESAGKIREACTYPTIHTNINSKAIKKYMKKPKDAFLFPVNISMLLQRKTWCLTWHGPKRIKNGQKE
jgi:hypothetical protein